MTVFCCTELLYNVHMVLLFSIFNSYMFYSHCRLISQTFKNILYTHSNTQNYRVHFYYHIKYDIYFIQFRYIPSYVENRLVCHSFYRCNQQTCNLCTFIFDTFNEFYIWQLILIFIYLGRFYQSWSWLCHENSRDGQSRRMFTFQSSLFIWSK